MNMMTQRKIGIGIMTVGLIIGVYGLLISFDDLYNISILVFLIGIIVNDWAIYRLLGRYESEYGRIEE